MSQTLVVTRGPREQVGKCEKITHMHHIQDMDQYTSNWKSINNYHTKINQLVYITPNSCIYLVCKVDENWHPRYEFNQIVCVWNLHFICLKIFGTFREPLLDNWDFTYSKFFLFICSKIFGMFRGTFSTNQAFIYSKHLFVLTFSYFFAKNLSKMGLN